MNRKLGVAGGVFGAVLLVGHLQAASREDRASASSLVAAYTEAWNRQDRGPFSIELPEDSAFGDILARFPHDPRSAAEAGASRLTTRVVGFRTFSPDRFAVEVEWQLEGRSGRLVHSVERHQARYEIAATAERPGPHAASAQ